ncbi:hypothetical protein D3C76_711260 [compost metagenome]
MAEEPVAAAVEPSPIATEPSPLATALPPAATEPTPDAVASAVGIDGLALKYRVPLVLMFSMATLVAFNWLMLTASVSSTPAATLVIRRFRFELPTETVFSTSATEPYPNAMLPSAVALAELPSATLFFPLAVE